MLRMLQHPNLVKLIGYCAEGHHKLLVYEFMSGGSLADHLFGESYSLKYLPNIYIYMKISIINVSCYKFGLWDMIL